MEYRHELFVPHSKSGIVPRSSLLGAGQLGFWEVGKGGTIGNSKGSKGNQEGRQGKKRHVYMLP